MSWRGTSGTSALPIRARFPEYSFRSFYVTLLPKPTNICVASLDLTEAQALEAESGDFIAVDWGTTRRRAMRVGGTARREIDEGIGVSGLRRDQYAGECAAMRRRFGDLPILAAGMVGSRGGWSETRYLPLPVGLGDLAAQVHTITESPRVAIVPGVARFDQGGDEGRRDVMRGEEVQTLGAVAAGLIPADALVCQPGTHNKWVTMQGGRIVDFSTVMTGELFAMLKKGGTIAAVMADAAYDEDAFLAGVGRGASGTCLSALLFEARAAALLADASPAFTNWFVSGMLIGADVRHGLRDGVSTVHVLGADALADRYALAVAALGATAIRVDAISAFVAGMSAIHIQDYMT